MSEKFHILVWNEPYQQEDRVAQQVPPPPKILGAKPQAVVSRLASLLDITFDITFGHLLRRFLCVCI